MNGRSQGRAQIGRSRSDITEVLIVRELGHLLDFGGSLGESCEYGQNVSALLHGDDAELVLLVDPDQEGLLSVVEDTTATGPVTVEVAGLEEAISLLEEEVIIDELLLGLLIHSLERVEGTLEVTGEGAARLHHHVHYLEALRLGHAGAKRVPV